MAYVIIQEFDGDVIETYFVIGVVSDLYSATKVIDTLKDIQTRLTPLMLLDNSDSLMLLDNSDSVINHFTQEELKILGWVNILAFNDAAFEFCDSRFTYSEAPFRNCL